VALCAHRVVFGGSIIVFRLLWKLVNFLLMTTGFFVLLTILAVAGLLAWDYVDQAMSQGKDEQAVLPPAAQGSSTTAS